MKDTNEVLKEQLSINSAVFDEVMELKSKLEAINDSLNKIINLTFTSSAKITPTIVGNNKSNSKSKEDE